MTKTEAPLHAAKTHTTNGQDGAFQSDGGRLGVQPSTFGGRGTSANPEPLFGPSSAGRAARTWSGAAKRLSLLAAATMVYASGALAQPASEVLRPAAASSTTAAGVIPLAMEQPPARIVVDSPLAEPLARGLVVLQYQTENLRIVPVFGLAALGVSPRVGHLHVTVDDLPWHWADASGVPLIIQGLPPGPHRVLIELANANHHVVDQRVVEFVVPDVGQRSPPATQASSR